MRKKNIAWIVFALVISVGIFWWTSIKKKVVKDAVTVAVQKKTDSLYKITYDTSEIDEVSGDAILKNVRIRLDSAQWLKLVEKDSMPPVTVSLTVDRITVKGLKELKLLSNSSLDVSAIILDRPVFRLDKWARKRPGATLNDTLELYKRLLGNFDFLRAGSIQVVNGDFTFMSQLRNDSLSAKGININIDNFLVDSAHNYRNLVSYFVKQAKVTINAFNSKAIKTGKILYDSKSHFISLDNLVTDQASGFPLTVKSIVVSGLSTEAFIYNGKVNARSLLITEPNGVLNQSSKKAGTVIDTSFSGAIDSLIIKKGNFTVRNKEKPPIVIKNINLLLKDVRAEKGKLPFEDYLNPKSCVFTVGSIKLPMGFHDVTVQEISYPDEADLLIKHVTIKPRITRQELKTKIGKQADMYDVTAKDLLLHKIDLKKIIKNNALTVDYISLQMNFHVFDDKTIKMDSAKRESGRFPYEALGRSKMKIDIGSVLIKNSVIAYEEQAPKSGMNGTVFFTNVNGKATNITNLPEQLAKDNAIHLDATAKVMGQAPMHTRWNLPLTVTDGSFTITGAVDPFPVTVLSPPFEALSLSKIRSGFANKLVFEINGNHEGSTGTVLLNYENLKVDLLKKGKDDSVKKKGLLSFIANADIKNSNQSAKGKEYHFKKDRYKSFFNLLWKSIFEGGKNTILIVK